MITVLFIFNFQNQFMKFQCNTFKLNEIRSGQKYEDGMTEGRTEERIDGQGASLKSLDITSARDSKTLMIDITFCPIGSPYFSNFEAV